MMSMQMSDSTEVLRGSSSARTRLEYILMGVNLALGIAVFGFIIGVASIRTRMRDEAQDILNLELEIDKCEAQLTTTWDGTTTPSAGTADTTTNTPLLSTLLSSTTSSTTVRSSTSSTIHTTTTSSSSESSTNLGSSISSSAISSTYTSSVSSTNTNPTTPVT
ncbi:hypothetical protein SK128_015002, partial [Halocaridina rubra]